MSQKPVIEPYLALQEILVVDDQEFVRHRWKTVLEQASFRVRLAKDGEEALEEIRKAAPDLVILDLNMPNMKGDEVCRRIKTSHQTESIPVIMVTASTDAENKIESLRYGANDYLVKEELAKTGNEELVQRVRNVLRLREDNRDGNPLTGLPGNPKIERELDLRIWNEDTFAFLYVDLDDFKAFNDYYGYRRGDLVILRFADLIRRVVIEHGDPETDFIGHIGGDDFAIITTPERADEVAGAVVEEFEAMRSQLFDEETCEAGHFWIEGRTGKKERFELMSVTIAVVTNEVDPLQHPAEVNDRAMELKRLGKQHHGSYIARERRGP